MAPIIAPQINLVFKPDFPFSDEREREICRRYWELLPDGSFAHNVKKLGKEVREPQHSFHVYVSTRCTARSEMVCACGVTETHEIETHHEYEALKNEPSNCTACTKKRSDAEQETRERAANEQKAAEEREQARVEAEWKAAEADEHARREYLRSELRRVYPLGEPNNPQSLQLRHAMYWFALVSRQDEPWKHGIPAVVELDKLWIGDCYLEQEILEVLLERGSLYIDHEMVPFGEPESDCPFRQLRWRLSAPEHAELAQSYVLDTQRIMPDAREWPTHWRHEYVEVFEEVASMECIGYWRNLHNEFEIQWNFEDECPQTRWNSKDEFMRIIKEALTVLSVGQIAWTMWGVMKTVTSKCEAASGSQAFYRFAVQLLRKWIRRNMQAPSDENVRSVQPQGFATEVALSIMSGTEAPWYDVSMRGVHELLRVADASIIHDDNEDIDE